MEVKLKKKKKKSAKNSSNKSTDNSTKKTSMQSSKQNAKELDSSVSVSPPIIDGESHIIAPASPNWRITKKNPALPPTGFVEYHVIGLPIDADEYFLNSWFWKVFRINSTTCTKLVGKNRKLSYSSFKVLMPSKYDWLFFGDNNLIFKRGNIEFRRWTSPKLAAASVARQVLAHKKLVTFNPLISRISYETDNINNNLHHNSISKSNFVSKINSNVNSNNNNNNIDCIYQDSSDSDPNIVLSQSTFSPNLLYSNFTPGPTLIPYLPGSSKATASEVEPKPPSTDLSFPVSNLPSSISPSLSPSTPVSNSPLFCNPLIPPVVNLTHKSVEENDSCYALSRLRDNRIFENVRLFLSYLYNKDDSVCIGGKTNTSLKIAIQQEGLPCDVMCLRNIYDKFHLSFGISPAEVTSDLISFASHVASNRTIHLQRVRESHNKFFRPL